jgi:hypothetical protein
VVYNFAEIANVLLALLLAPIVITSGRRVGFRGKSWFSLGLVALGTAFVLAVVDGLATAPVVNLVEHASLALGSILICVGLWRYRASMRADAEQAGR